MAAISRFGFLVMSIAVALPAARVQADETGAAKVGGPRFEVVLDSAIAKQSVTGQLFVFLSQRSAGQPVNGPNWFRPEPFFRLDVVDFVPGTSRMVDDTAAGFPRRLSKLPPGKYRVQAILDHDFYQPRAALGVGNFYSDVAEVELKPRSIVKLRLDLKRRVEARPFPENRWVRLVEMRSPRLSKFHHRKVMVRAAVVLPRSYDEQPERKYPTLYIISGFGGTLEQMARRYAGGPPAADSGEVEFIRVLLSGNCKWGHHAYADGPTNGPRGTSLVKELIPRVESRFRAIGRPTARLLTGHSSGGWASLWLQVSFPENFGGVWSTAPDPVDFRDFQQVDLYRNPPESLYFDEAGNRRPLARRGTTPVIWYEDFARMDDVLGRGGQLRSFEAVFSPLDERGLPRKLWDRRSGRIDPAIAQAWRKYDIRLKLERNWKALEPKLRGKLHIYMGTLDTFYLNGAVERLAETLARLKSDARVHLVEGADHVSLLSPERLRTIRHEMSDTVRRHHPAMVPRVSQGQEPGSDSVPHAASTAKPSGGYRLNSPPKNSF